jgi:hypothetical protein
MRGPRFIVSLQFDRLAIPQVIEVGQVLPGSDCGNNSHKHSGIGGGGRDALGGITPFIKHSGIGGGGRDTLSGTMSFTPPGIGGEVLGGLKSLGVFMSGMGYVFSF